MAFKTPPQEPIDRRHVSKMFDGIAANYDRSNRWLSFGRDLAWRRVCMRHLEPGEERLRILDLATGTADVLVALHRAYGAKVWGTGADFSSGMLEHGRRKLTAQGLDRTFSLLRADATRLGLADNTFDRVTIAFGIRNVMDTGAALREMHRILKPGGRALVLEFSLPGNALFRALYLFYFRHILPVLGGLIAGDIAAYRYLNRTVETFPYGEAFCALLRDAGFTHVTALPLTRGIATLYLAEKKPDADWTQPKDKEGD
jgi:demethylmenaquinone methyltransferase/2-methoxy-6-polyprenyl-1,4-benzoquinol methylase